MLSTLIPGYVDNSEHLYLSPLLWNPSQIEAMGVQTQI